MRLEIINVYRAMEHTAHDNRTDQFSSCNLIEYPVAIDLKALNKAMPTNWYKMAAIMNRYCENDGIEGGWEAECASFYQKGANLDKANFDNNSCPLGSAFVCRAGFNFNLTKNIDRTNEEDALIIRKHTLIQGLINVLRHMETELEVCFPFKSLQFALHSDYIFHQAKQHKRYEAHLTLALMGRSRRLEWLVLWHGPTNVEYVPMGRWAGGIRIPFNLVEGGETEKGFVETRPIPWESICSEKATALYFVLKNPLYDNAAASISTNTNTAAISSESTQKNLLFRVECAL
ncbi:hypothetical protein C0J52_25285 [Blattella germanica]|nr:hypothetical protein C0J52_25285 [Blattella germanica]